MTPAEATVLAQDLGATVTLEEASTGSVYLHIRDPRSSRGPVTLRWSDHVHVHRRVRRQHVEPTEAAVIAAVRIALEGAQ